MDIRTFEGYVLLKEFKNHSGDKRPLTIDCKNEQELRAEIARIKKAFEADGYYNVKIEVNERK